MAQFVVYLLGSGIDHSPDSIACVGSPSIPPLVQLLCRTAAAGAQESTSGCALVLACLEVRSIFNQSGMCFVNVWWADARANCAIGQVA
jgi:hypothetical protein